MTKTYYLYSRDSKKKVRAMILETLPGDVGYIIRKKSGLLNGKLTIQPEKLIEKGKVKRTVEQQLELEVNSIINKQKDKGYIQLETLVDVEIIDKIDPMDYEFIDSLLSQNKKDAQGDNKPMLAQDANKTDKKTGELAKDPEGPFYKRAWWVSPKIDGVRTLGKIKVDEAGEEYIHFTSRSGKQYTASVLGFTKDPELIAFMKEHDCEIDGEIYCHGVHLNKLSGDARKQTYVPERHDKLEFWVFDIAKEDMDAQDRAKILNDLKLSNPKIIVLKHDYVMSYDEIKDLHDKYVEQGFEGAMARTATGKYEFGKRSNEIWKFKLFEDAEFLITGTEEGARPEDMCFTMETEDGKPFNCKPMGGADMIEYYRENLDTIIGKKGTVKFFGWTSKGIPNIAKFKCVKDEDE